MSFLFSFLRMSLSLLSPVPPEPSSPHYLVGNYSQSWRIIRRPLPSAAGHRHWAHGPRSQQPPRGHVTSQVSSPGPPPRPRRGAAPSHLQAPPDCNMAISQRWNSSPSPKINSALVFCLILPEVDSAPRSAPRTERPSFHRLPPPQHLPICPGAGPAPACVELLLFLKPTGLSSLRGCVPPHEHLSPQFLCLPASHPLLLSNTAPQQAFLIPRKPGSLGHITLDAVCGAS